MYDLLKSIQTVFNDATDLKTLFPNGCYLTLAPYGTPLPTCVVTVASAVPSYQTDRLYITNYNLTFTVRSPDGDWAIQATEAIKEHFDFEDFTVQGFVPTNFAPDFPQDFFGGSGANITVELIECRRVNEGTVQEDERVAQAFVTYQIQIEETLPE